ncbi:MAG: hypothetical protein AAGK14_03085 [Verrucomicrobiota bacterium]
MSRIDDALDAIAQIGESSERTLATCGLISTLLRIKNVQSVVVGPFAYACYAQMQDARPSVLLQTKTPHLPVRIIYEVMAEMLPAHGHQAEWNLLGTQITFGGQFVSEHTELCRDLQTDFGIVSLMPPEQLIADYIVAANQPYQDAVSVHRAKRLMALAMENAFDLDWNQLREIADGENYRVGELAAQLRQQTKAELDAAQASETPAPAAEPAPEPETEPPTEATLSPQD